MGVRTLAEAETPDGNEIVIGEQTKGRSGKYMLIMYPFHMETVIHFTEVEKSRSTYEFKSEKPVGPSRTSRTVNTGSIESGFDYGEVGEWLDHFVEHDKPPEEDE